MFHRKKLSSCQLAVNLFPQLPRAFKRDDPLALKHYILPGCWISASSALFVFHTKFTEAGDHYVITGFRGRIDKFQQYFHGFNRLLWVNPFVFATASIILALVKVLNVRMVGASFHLETSNYR